jgi:PAS domain S-box-containing protein
VSASAANKPLSIKIKNRTLLIFATSIVGLHILQAVFVGHTPFGSFIANLLQILSAVVATIACARAVRRGRGFTRPFWILIGLSFVIWIAADLGWMYYESYLSISPPRDSIFHFFVDVRSLFLAMALLLDQDEEERPYYLDAGSLLDGVQLFIIFSLLYLGWYHIFSLHENRVLSILRSDQIEVSENFAVLALAVLQVMRAQTRELRNLYLGFLGCFGLLGLATSFTDYRELRMGREISTGSWADLGWTIPFLLTAWWAYGWKQRPGFYARDDKEQSLLSMLFENTIYSAGPLIVLLQAFELGPPWRKLSLPLLGISILCFGVRLALSKFREAEAASQLREVNKSLRESEGRLREFERVVEGLDEMITVVDRDYRYLLTNQVFLNYRGVKKGDLIGREVRDVLDPEVFDSVVKPRLDECFKGKVVQYEMSYDYPERGRRNLSISYFPISGAQGVDRAACILEDITERKRSEQALRESEDRYRDLVEHSEDLVCTHDLQGKLLSVNPAPARILGYEVAELLGTPMRDLLAPDFREQFDAYLETIKTEGAAKGFVCVLAKSGERRIWEYSNSLRTEGVSSPVVRGLAHDVTDRTKAEGALLESEGRMRLFVEHSPAAVALFDREMRYIQASKRWVNDYGLGDRELHGLSHYEVFSEIPEEWKEAHRRGLAGEVLQEEGDRFERADGTVQFLRWQIHPWHEANGQIGGIAIFTEDITARKHAESTLRSSEQRYRMLFEKNIAGVAISDADGIVLDCNDAWAQMLGYDSAEEIRGRHASEFYFDINDRAPLLEEIKRYGTFRSKEMHLRRKDHSSVWVLFNSVVRRAEDGVLIRQATAIDVTERKRAEIELQRSEQRLKLAMQAGCIGAFEADLETGRGMWTPELANIWGAAESVDADMVGYCWDHTHPKDLARIRVEFSRITETGGQGEMEFRILRPNGEQRWIRWFGRVIQGPDASRRAIGVNIDITKEKEADEALRRSEERFRVALQKSPISVVNQDRDLRYTWTTTLTCIGSMMYSGRLTRTSSDQRKPDCYPS